MFRICTTAAQHSGRLPRRRDFLRLGGLGLAGLGVAGLSLPTLLAQSNPTIAPGALFGRAKRCLLLFLTGGPPQHDTFDPKPKAPAEI